MTGLAGWQAAVALLAVAAGATLQGAIGFGFAFVVVPAFTVLRPEAVPVTPLLLALPLTGWMAYRERQGIDLRGVAAMTAGRAGGTVAGAWLLTRLAARPLSVLAGAAILGAVALQSRRRSFQPRRGQRVVAGFVSGAMGTTAALGGPAMALAYQGSPGRELRPTLALGLFVGILLSLAVLAVAGEVAARGVALAAALAPGVAVGLLARRRLAPLLDGDRLRPAILLLAGLFGLAALLRGLLGG